MQSYREIEREEAKEVMEQDLAMVRFHGVVDKAYSTHRKQRKEGKKVNLSFNRLAFSVKHQISH